MYLPNWYFLQKQGKNCTVAQDGFNTDNTFTRADDIASLRWARVIIIPLPAIYLRDDVSLLISRYAKYQYILFLSMPTMSFQAAEMPSSKHATQKSLVPDSLPVPPEAYEGDEFFCQFTPRIHRDSYLADSGCWQCQLDLLGSQGRAHADAVRNRSNKSYAVGCINPTVGNFTALCASEAIPERLALISYIVEYAYVHDDGKIFATLELLKCTH